MRKDAPDLHKSIGLVLLGVMLLRVLWRFVSPPPPAPANHGTLTRMASKAGHGLLYLGLFAAMIAGYLISTADGVGIPVFGLFEVPALVSNLPDQADVAGEIHFYLAWGLVIFAGLHGLAALKHHFIDRDATLIRMLGRKACCSTSTPKGYRRMLKKTFAALALGTALFSAGQAMAADYKIDKEGQHAFVDWKISHLGYSFIHGTFKDFDGSFSWDSTKPEASKIAVDLKTASLWSNHAERDKHIASKDFLDVSKFPEAKFVSTAVKSTGEKTADVTGDLTLHGVTKPVIFKAVFNGEGKDPWGGERAGFNAKTTLNLNDFGIKGPGPSSQTLDLDISIEGVKQK